MVKYAKDVVYHPYKKSLLQPYLDLQGVRYTFRTVYMGISIYYAITTPR